MFPGRTIDLRLKEEVRGEPFRLGRVTRFALSRNQTGSQVPRRLWKLTSRRASSEVMGACARAKVRFLYLSGQ